MILNTIKYWREYVKQRIQKVAVTLPIEDPQSSQVETSKNSVIKPTIAIEASNDQQTLLDLSNSLSSIEDSMNSSSDRSTRPNTVSAR